MTLESVGLDPALHRYLLAHSERPDTLLSELARETQDHVGELSRMQIAPEQGALLTLLARLGRARFAVEIGTFTGYSSICIATGVGPQGRLVCFDSSQEWTAVAQRYWARAGLEDRIELRLGDARETLESLVHDPPIDLAFIDADKRGYPLYFEAVLERLAPDGLVVVDNVFQGGRVLDPDDDSDDEAMATFNAALLADDRVEVVMLPVADGISLVSRAPANPAS